MNRSSVVRGLLSLSVLGIGLVAAGIAVAAGCSMCVTNPSVAWALVIGPQVVVAGLVWIVLPPVFERPPARPAAPTRHHWNHAPAAVS
jgi:hypothetical protein